MCSRDMHGDDVNIVHGLGRSWMCMRCGVHDLELSTGLIGRGR